MHHQVTVHLVIESSFTPEEIQCELAEVLRHLFFDVKVGTITVEPITKEMYDLVTDTP